MFYINPCYVDYFESYDSAQYKYSAADSVSTTPYIKRSSSVYSHTYASYCKKDIDNGINDLYVNAELYIMNSYCSAEVLIDIEDNGVITKENVYDVTNSGKSNGLTGGGNFIPYKGWYKHSFHFYFSTNSDGKKVLQVSGTVNGNDISGSSTNTYTNPTIKSIYFAESFYIRNIVIADFVLKANDEVTELTASAHGGDFVANSDGSYELTEVEKAGTVTLDTSGIKTTNSKIVAASYMADINRNNDDITDVDISYAGQTVTQNLNDGNNITITSFTDDIDMSALGTVTITAKKG